MKTSLSVQECSAEEYADILTKVPHEAPVSFLQAPFYGAWQERDGKTVVYFAVSDDSGIVAAGVAVKYDAPGGISFFYCPYGPIIAHWTSELYNALRDFFAPIAKRTGTTFVRLDSDAIAAQSDIQPVANHLAVTASLQPRSEWLLDISGDQEAIWMGMHKHARYNVRLAERANAKLDFYAPADAPMDVISALMQTTAGRDKFSLQSRAYYEGVLASIPAENGFVAVCTIDGKPAAFGIFAAYDQVMHYVYAGSSDDFRKIAPPYFLIWNSILEARKRSWNTLNFGGITDDVKGTHLAGVTGFKKRFGGYEQTHKNPIDIVYNRPKYTLFSLYKRFLG
jgi:lipid II:glycine glycyltransferase (peptidoglycan interpeptide bridge formation enzyme)